jgi:GT2 family glycosyltransferase
MKRQKMSESRRPLVSDDVGVVVLNYNSWPDTVLCLESLLRLSNPPRRIIVCDNGSNDDSIQRLMSWSRGQSLWMELAGDRIKDAKQLWSILEKPGLFPTPFTSLEDGPIHNSQKPELILMAMPKNLGFSAGNNAALRLLLRDQKCRAFWLLNSDTIVDPDALDWLLLRANNSPEVGCVGSTLAFWEPSGSVQCTAGAQFNRLLGTTSFLGNGLRLEEACSFDPIDVDKKLDYIVAASMLVRRECLIHTGLLVEDYFLYYEDVEWGIRMRKAGFGLAWAPRSVVHHREGGASGASSRSSERRSKFIDYLSLRNRIFTVRQHYPLFLPITLLGIVGVLYRRIQRRQWDRLGVVLRAVGAGLIGNMSFNKG